MSQKGTCTHIKVNGVRCGSPALKGEQFCYFHQNAHRGVSRPKESRLHPIALIEDEESIQYALMEVMNALMRNTIDLKRAALILRALHIAVKNASRVKYHEQAKHMVTQIPSYEMPTEEHEDLAREADLPAVAANPHLHIGPEGPHYWEQRSEAARQKNREDAERYAVEAKVREECRRRFTEEIAQEAEARKQFQPAEATPTHVGTDAFVRPAKPQASKSAPEADSLTRSATTSMLESSRTPATSPAGGGTSPNTRPNQTSAATKIPSHNFKNQPQQPTPPKPPASTRTADETTSQRKPPASAIPAPKERKHAAHRASGG